MARYTARDPEGAKKLAMAKMKQQAEVINFGHAHTYCAGTEQCTLRKEILLGSRLPNRK